MTSEYRATVRRIEGMPLFTDKFYRIEKLPPYVFAVINEMKAKKRAAGLDVVDFGMGNPDGPSPRPVVSKLVEASRDSINHRYSLSKGIEPLRKEIVARYKQKYNVDLNPETEAIVTIGAKDALAHLLFAVIGPDDVVVSPNPAYPIHQYGVIMAEGHACTLAMPNPAEFLNGVEHIYRTSARRPKMILVSFPHNPTTQTVEIGFFKDLVAMAAKHGTIVVHDFAYADLGFDGYRPPSILEVDGAKEVAVEIYSMSKSFNMAGWRVGFCLGNPTLIGALARIKSYLDYGVFQPIQIASIVALRECEDETTKIRDIYQKRRDVLVNGLRGAGWPVESPRASMFLWAQIPESHRHLGSLEFSKQLMEEALVAVSPGIGFGPMGEGYVRFALIENNTRARQAIHSIERFLSEPPA
jgi:alanine-synthesizing transaminase